MVKINHPLLRDVNKFDVCFFKPGQITGMMRICADKHSIVFTNIQAFNLKGDFVIDHDAFMVCYNQRMTDDEMSTALNVTYIVLALHRKKHPSLRKWTKRSKWELLTYNQYFVHNFYAENLCYVHFFLPLSNANIP